MSMTNEERGYEMRINPDTNFVKNLKKRIKSNNKYCLNKPKGDADNKCPCREYREEGKCDCGMYFRVDL